MLIQKIGYDILCGFLIVITLGLAYPATLCIKQKWYAKHTVYDGQRLYFDGKGIQLFGLWILWWFLSIITCGIFALVLPKKILAWKTKHTHVCCENKEFGSEFKGSGVVYVLLLIGLSLLNVITLSIAVPFTTCWHIKWVAKHTSLDGRRIAFDGKGIQLLGKWILWAFLTLITVGIYGFFLSIKMEKWKVSHTHFID
ncbi:MAG: DUF898 family protein [Clostridia bacterium]|nr:DUF898 family protein [Clostridia bacterium]